MENEVLNTILNRLDSINSSIKDLYNSQEQFRQEQKEMKEDINGINSTIGNMQDDISGIHSSIDSMQVKIDNLQENMCAVQLNINGLGKNSVTLRDDVETIYTLQKDSLRILNVHTKQLNKLINLAEENKEEHSDFDKRISRLESLIS